MKDKYIVMFTGLKGMLNKGDTSSWGHCQGSHGLVTLKEAGSWELPASTAGADKPSLGPVAPRPLAQQGLAQQIVRAGPVGQGHQAGHPLGTGWAWRAPGSAPGASGIYQG